MTKSRIHRLLPVVSICSAPAQGVHGSLTKSLGITVRAWEDHKEKSVAGADPEQSHHRAVGVGKRCWHWFSSKPNWENVKWLPSGVARDGRWSGGGGLPQGSSTGVPPLCPCPSSELWRKRKSYTSLWPSDDPATLTGWPPSKWHFQIMNWSTDTGSYLCRSIFIK